jgi:hypothetical protein
MKRLRVHVKVNALDIASGFRDCGGGCPLALAIHRAIGAPVDVGPESIFEYNEAFDREDDPGRRLAKLPPRARRFLAEFDASRKVRPFGFYLRLAPRDVMGDPR